MDEFPPVCKFTYMQNNLHMCKFGHENGALIRFLIGRHHIAYNVRYRVQRTVYLIGKHQFLIEILS